MGLDGVELLMDIEETFGVAIPDDLAQRMVTVDDLYRFLIASCTLDRQTACLTSIAFYQLRRGICESGDIPRHAVRPSTRIDSLAARRGYRRFWGRLQRSMHRFRLPSLGRPSWLWRIAVYANGILLLLALASVPIQLYVATKVGMLVIPLIVSQLAIMAVWLVMAEPVACCLPHNFETVGELARLTIHTNEAWFLARQKSWNEDQIWEDLRKTVANTLGVRLEDVTPQARFVDDLGIG